MNQTLFQRTSKEATTSRNEQDLGKGKDKISDKVGDGSSSLVKTLTAPIGCSLMEKIRLIYKTFTEKKIKYSSRIFCSIHVVSLLVHYIYFLAPRYFEAELAHCLCESYLDATDSELFYYCLERGEARQYCSTLARR